MIRFTKLRYKNMLSTGNSWTEIQLDKDPTTLIVGPNGGGKSTMIDALQFCWFGKPYRKINKGQLVNSITRKECVVEGEALVGSKHVRVVRGIKPNLFEIYENGDLVDQSAASKDYQEYLEKQVLQLTPRAFSQIVVLGSANYVPFMQLTTSQRRELIEDLLDLKVFTTMNSLLKVRVDENNQRVKDLQNEHKLISEKLRLTKIHAQQVEENNEALIAEKQERVEAALTSVFELTGELDAEIKKAEDLEVQRKEALQQHNESVRNMKRSVADYISELKTTEPLTEHKKLKKLEQIEAQLKAKVSLLKKDKEFLEKNDHCPTCKQEIHGDFKSKHVQEKQGSIDEILKALPELEEEKTKLNEILKDYVQRLQEAEKNGARDIGQVEKDALDSSALFQRKTTEQNAVISGIKVQINSKQSYVAEIEREIESLRTKKKVEPEYDIDALTYQVGIIEFDLEEARKMQELYSAGSLFLKDTGIKSQIVKQYVPVINKVINKYLSAMDFFVDFRFDENFNETIKSRFRDEFTYASFSEGEKMRLDLAILFTWRAIAKLRNSMTTNLTIFDEICDSSLDVNGTDEFLKIIKVAEGVNTFVISHKTDTIIDKFDRVIEFRKNQNFSSIVED